MIRARSIDRLSPSSAASTAVGTSRESPRLIESRLPVPAGKIATGTPGSHQRGHRLHHRPVAAADTDQIRAMLYRLLGEVPRAFLGRGYQILTAIAMCGQSVADRLLRSSGSVCPLTGLKMIVTDLSSESTAGFSAAS